MITKPVLVILLFLTSAGVAFTQVGNPQLDLPVDLTISVELNLNSDGSGFITLTNQSDDLITVAHPTKFRAALSYSVTDEYGNYVKPVGIAKVDPTGESINLPVNKSSVIKIPALSFISGTAKYEYQLEEGKRYRVIAVYRPAGLKGPGFCSQESIILYNKAK